MEDFKIKANEIFFKNVISLLNEKGIWTWKDYPNIPFIKIDGKLQTTKEGMDLVSKIVSVDFLLDNFSKKY
jgi:hypothetical protein